VTASLTTFFGLLGALLVLAFVANRLSKWTRVPDVIVLLITGIALGPVLHWVDGSKFGEVTPRIWNVRADSDSFRGRP
jgi:Kef-type K+ transport system membrane component KefB